jgi:hypothetical protein
MKYYNNEIEARNKGSGMDDKILEDLLHDVKEQINGSQDLLRLELK